MRRYRLYHLLPGGCIVILGKGQLASRGLRRRAQIAPPCYSYSMHSLLSCTILVLGTEGNCINYVLLLGCRVVVLHIIALLVNGQHRGRLLEFDYSRVVLTQLSGAFVHATERHRSSSTLLWCYRMYHRKEAFQLPWVRRSERKHTHPKVYTTAGSTY